MFNSAILDMVVLLFFTYFICSVLLSVIVEMIATALRLRADQLESNLKTMFFDKTDTTKETMGAPVSWTDYVSKAIIGSPFYQSLQKDSGAKPQYMPAENFAKAVLDSLRDGNEALTIEGVKKKLRDSEVPVPSCLKKILLGYVDTADSDIKKLQSQMEGFYNNSMDRASGWYKERIKPISIIVSVILVFSINVDTIEIIQKSTRNPAALKIEADRIASHLPDLQQVATDMSAKVSPSDTNNIKELKTQLAKIQTLKGQLDNGVFSIGYTGFDDFCNKWSGGQDTVGSIILAVILKIFGMALTVLALQVGSTYWFDALNKVVNLRAAGKKPERTVSDSKQIIIQQ